MEASFLELARELDTERAFNMTYNLEGYAHVSSVMLSVRCVPNRHAEPDSPVVRSYPQTAWVY